MDKNRELHELLGLEWKEEWQLKDANGEVVLIPREDNPDYTDDPRLVLREMKKREDFHRFVAKINAFSLDEDDALIDNAIPVDLILDTTGKLRDLAIEWLKGNL